jgi:hypothetical protein
VPGFYAAEDRGGPHRQSEEPFRKLCQLDQTQVRKTRRPGRSRPRDTRPGRGLAGYPRPLRCSAGGYGACVLQGLVHRSGQVGQVVVGDGAAVGGHGDEQAGAVKRVRWSAANAAMKAGW